MAVEQQQQERTSGQFSDGFHEIIITQKMEEEGRGRTIENERGSKASI